MKRKVILCFILTLMITIFPGFPCHIGFATEAPDFNYEASSQGLIALKQQPGIIEINGEIISIAPTNLILRIHGALQCYAISPKVRLFCNGCPATWKALAPVTPESFFEAKLLINQSSEAIAIDGYYYGEPCVIKDWRCREGRLQSLKIFSPGAHITIWKTVRDQDTAPASFPPDLSWLELEREIFALYSFKGEIRAIFLPEGF